MLMQLNFVGSLRRDPGQRERDGREHHHDGQRDEQFKKRDSCLSHRTLTIPFPSGKAPAAGSPFALISATRIGDTPGAFAENLAVTFLPPVDPCGAEPFTRNTTMASARSDGGESAASICMISASVKAFRFKTLASYCNWNTASFSGRNRSS